MTQEDLLFEVMCENHPDVEKDVMKDVIKSAMRSLRDNQCPSDSRKLGGREGEARWPRDIA